MFEQDGNSLTNIHSNLSTEFPNDRANWKSLESAWSYMGLLLGYVAHVGFAPIKYEPSDACTFCTLPAFTATAGEPFESQLFEHPSVARSFIGASSTRNVEVGKMVGSLTDVWQTIAFLAVGLEVFHLKACDARTTRLNFLGR